MVFYILRPSGWGFRLVKGLPRNGLADGHRELFVHVLVHLVDEEEHGDVELDAQFLRPVGQPVELVRVLSAEMDGHHIAVCLHALGDERLCPRQVMYLSIDFA